MTFPPHKSPLIKITMQLIKNPTLQQLDSKMVMNDASSTVNNHVGKFTFHRNLTRRHISRLTHLDTYFDEKKLESIVLPLICMNSKISLRLLNWFVISYCKQHQVIIQKKNTFIHIYNDYRSSLRCWKRPLFDAFRRGPRIYFTIQNTQYSTTVAQLNYIHWALRHGVLKHLYDQWPIIHKQMTKTMYSNNNKTAKLSSKSSCPVPMSNIFFCEHLTTIQL